MKPILFFLLLTSTFSVSAQNVYIPDTNFRNYLLANTLINTNLDNEIQVSEAAACDSLYCGGLNISDLTGIEAFTTLTYLNCYINNLTTLDLTNNHALVNLICSVNQLDTLKLSTHPNMAIINCAENMISELNLSGCPALTRLDASNNKLVAVDVSSLVFLEKFGAHHNLLTTVDLSHNPQLNRVLCYNNLLSSLNIANGNNPNIATFEFNATNNPNLTCIQVDNASYSTANWPVIDSQTSYSENCNYSGNPELTLDLQVVRITNLLGQETRRTSGEVLIYHYNDGSQKLVFQVEGN